MKKGKAKAKTKIKAKGTASPAKMIDARIRNWATGEAKCSAACVP